MCLPDAADVERFARDVARLIGRGGSGEPPRLALAVSGGADSMAMLALAAAAFPGNISVGTFDHRLRAASAGEAQLVAGLCATLGVPHVTLTPVRPISGASIQAQAREARYDALLHWAVRERCDFLLTAHHADDQAETLLMRLNRASGLAGLAAIRPVRKAGEATIIRPLLGWRRTELRAVVTACAIPFVEDPSNDDPQHDRTRIRRLLATNPELNPLALAASAAFLEEAEEVIAREVRALWEARWRGPDQALVLGDLPRELQRRLLRRAVSEARRVSGIAQPRFGPATNVETVLDSLAAGRNATIGGVMIVSKADGLVLRAAPPRRS